MDKTTERRSSGEWGETSWRNEDGKCTILKAAECVRNVSTPTSAVDHAFRSLIVSTFLSHRNDVDDSFPCILAVIILTVTCRMLHYMPCMMTGTYFLPLILLFPPRLSLLLLQSVVIDFPHFKFCFSYMCYSYSRLWKRITNVWQPPSCVLL